MNNIQLQVVLGPAVPDYRQVAAELEGLGAEVFFNIPSVATLMHNADMGVTTGGNVTFEMASVGTPAITLCTRDRQMRHADFFQSKGTLVNLGLGKQVTAEEIRTKTVALMSDRERRAAMSSLGREIVDSQGLSRICTIIERIIATKEGY